MKKDKLWLPVSVALYLALSATAAPAGEAMLMGDAANGKTLHNANCTSCHDSSPYTRTNRSVNSIEALVGRVNGCNRQLETNLNKDQINDIVKYLNDTFYKF